jgi:hypothetical protein
VNNAASVELLLEKVSSLQQQINNIHVELEETEFFEIPTRTAMFNGISTAVIRNGSKCNFFLQGSTIGGGSFSNGSTYCIMTGADFPPLRDWHVGTRCIGTLWLNTGGVDYSLPLYFDKSGIYFTVRTGGVSFSAGAVFGCTQLLILTPRT